MIASSPTDLHAVLDAISRNGRRASATRRAARSCSSRDATDACAVARELRRRPQTCDSARRAFRVHLGCQHAATRICSGRAHPGSGGPIHVDDMAEAVTPSTRESRGSRPGMATAPVSASRCCAMARPIGVLIVQRYERRGRSPSSRSRCWRRSPTRRSSPSRTPGCSRSWSSATPSFRRATARSPRRWSSRPPRRDPAGHRRLADGSAVGARRDRRERRPALRAAERYEPLSDWRSGS